MANIIPEAGSVLSPSVATKAMGGSKDREESLVLGLLVILSRGSDSTIAFLFWFMREFREKQKYLQGGWMWNE